MAGMVRVFAVLCSLFATITASKAAVLTLGDGSLGFGEVGSYSNSAGPGAFADEFNFALETPSGHSSGTQAVGLGRTFDIDPATFRLEPFARPLPATSLAVAAASGNGLVLNAEGLLPRDYSLRVSGTAIGGSGGFYDGAFSVVPLPPAFILFASALIGLVGVSRSRRRPPAPQVSAVGGG